MPKLIGPEVHRNAVAEAVFRIVTRDGVEAASLRTVAHEANLAIDSVQQYFVSSAELLTFIRETIYERVTRRLDQQTPRLFTTDPAVTAAERRAATEDILAQFLPLDEERYQEAQLWLALSVHAATRPDLQPLIHDFYHSIRKGLPTLLAKGQQVGFFVDGLDIPVETERLVAVLHGLIVTALLHPDLMRPETMLEVLRQHLDSLSAAT